MKKLALTVAFCLTLLSGWAQDINQLLDSLKISVTTISFHPKGDILISTGYNREEKSQYLLLISDKQGLLSIDTLQADRPNRSAFSKEGEYIVYNFRDPISKEFYTVKRKYNGPGDIGSPFYISERLFTDNMYYYFMDENEDFYYYTYVRENRSEGGLLYSKFENGKYQKPQIIHPDRENAVAYSPLLLDDNTMIFAQHGIKDDTYRGVHFSKKNDKGKWSEPILLESIPMSDVITYYTDEKVAFLVAETYTLKFYDKSHLLSLIDDKLN